MSAGCVRWLLSRTAAAVCGGSPGYWTPASSVTTCSVRSSIVMSSWRRSPFCTAVSDTEQTPAPKKKKQNPKAHATIGNVGRKIPHRLIGLLSDKGEKMGTMHREDVIRVMDEKNLKLVLLSEDEDPPVYQLMTGKQIYEEKLKLQEKQKDRVAPVQVKELIFSVGITGHDLSTKLKQVESWLHKKHHVKITLRSGRGETAVNLDSTLEQMTQKIGVMVGFVSKPKVIRDGQAATCVLRLPSAKELKEKNKATASKSKDSSPKTPLSNNADTTEATVQE